MAPTLPAALAAWLAASVGWLILVQAAGLASRLPGLLVVGREAPRSAAAAIALLGLAWLAAAAWLAGSVAVAAGVLVAGGLTGLTAGLLLPSLRPLHPNRPFLEGIRGPMGELRALEVPGEPDAGALLLEPARPRGALVPVFHGGGNDRIFGLWYLLPELLEHGHAVLLAHLSGHGLGGADLFSVSSARRRVDALLEVARQEAAGRPVVLLGQSMGGAFALDALARGLPVDAAVTVSAPVRLSVGPSVLRELGAFARPALYRSLTSGTLLEILPAVGPFRRSRFPVRVASGETYVQGFAAALEQLELPARLHQAAVPPVLIVHGERDGIIPVDSALALKDALGPRGTLWIAPWLHHLDPLFDTAAVELLVRWIDDRAQAARPSHGVAPEPPLA